MVYQPPVGARDLLPLDVAQKRWIEDRLQHVFHSWGYHRIITSTLERMDTLMAGGAIERSTVIQLQELEGEALGLRPELTASIARTTVTRMMGTTLPQRLYYNANVFRRPSRGSHNRRQEIYQAGVELIGAGGTLADAEIMLLAVDCIHRLGLSSWSLVVGEAGLTRSLLSAFPDHLRPQVRTALAQLDRITLEALPLSPELHDRALLLLDLRGKPADVLQQVSQLDLDESQRAIVATLKTLTELLEACFTQRSQQGYTVPNLLLDLSLVQTFDYYTGIVFELVGQDSTGARILGQGGRYDQLLGLYHPQGKSYPGIGFIVNIDDLHQVLLPTEQLPTHTPAMDCLVVPLAPAAFAAAFAHAQHIREAAELTRVELDISGQPLDETRDYARRRSIRQIAWVHGDGTVEVEGVC